MSGPSSSQNQKEIKPSYLTYQPEVFDCPARNVVYAKGRRAGGTRGAISRLVEIALQQPGSRHLWVDTVRGNIDKYLNRYLRPMLKGIRHGWSAQRQVLRFPGGSVCDFGTAERPENLEALVKAYLAANNALASVPYPYNIPLAGVVLAAGLANVEQIRKVNVAHGGLERVPEDATYLLKQGERVLSPNQNKDLSRFLNQEPSGSASPVKIEKMTVHILENATNAESLLRMDSSDLKQVVTERLIPTLDELGRMGIRPHYTDQD